MYVFEAKPNSAGSTCSMRDTSRLPDVKAMGARDAVGVGTEEAEVELVAVASAVRVVSLDLVAVAVLVAVTVEEGEAAAEGVMGGGQFARGASATPRNSLPACGAAIASHVTMTASSKALSDCSSFVGVTAKSA